ncbi:MAG: hypothetical protein LBR43_00165 [Spiroplasmataceae bacterium]|nr:hypothetical protein [Spiroplasmataceae bacterium]
MNQAKVLQTTKQNLITLKDIRTRKKFWNKPEKENYQDLVFYQGWKHWTKEYNFLPVPDKFLEIREETLKILESLPNENKKEDKVFKIEYFLLHNRSNIIYFCYWFIRSL